MKRIILEGNLVINVEKVADNATGPLIVEDSVVVGPGFTLVNDIYVAPPPRTPEEPTSNNQVTPRELLLALLEGMVKNSVFTKAKALLILEDTLTALKR